MLMLLPRTAGWAFWRRQPLAGLPLAAAGLAGAKMLHGMPMGMPASVPVVQCFVRNALRASLADDLVSMAMPAGPGVMVCVQKSCANHGQQIAGGHTTVDQALAKQGNHHNTSVIAISLQLQP